MSVKDDLIAARALIDTPEKWAKGGELERPSCTLCTVDAVRAVIPRICDERFAVYGALNAALPDGGPPLLVDYNDAPTTTHADIMRLFDRAIEAAQ